MTMWASHGTLAFICCFMFTSFKLSRSFQIIMNVTRRSNGDIFTNPSVMCDSSACDMFEGQQVGGYYYDVCKCKCSHSKFTFLVHKIMCETDTRIPQELPSTLPNGLATNASEFRLSYNDRCSKPLVGVPVLNLGSTAGRVLCSVMGDSIRKDMESCNVVGRKSRYLYEGQWKEIWSSGRVQNTFSVNKKGIEQHLEWKSNLGQQFSGLIFALHISCKLQRTGSANRESYVIFKSTGLHTFYNGEFPTLSPTLRPTNLPVTRTTMNTRTLSPQPTTKSSTPSTTTMMTSTSSQGDSRQQSEGNTSLVIALSTVGTVLFLFIIAVVAYGVVRCRRSTSRKSCYQNYDRGSNSNLPSSAVTSLHKSTSNGGKSEANPTYERGPDTSQAMNGSNSQKYDTPSYSSSYQPLVQNTRLRDASGQIPVYQPLIQQTASPQPIKQTKTSQAKGPRHAYETVASPATHEGSLHKSTDYQSSHEYEEPSENHGNPDEGALYAVSTLPTETEDTLDYNNPGYDEPDKMIKV